MLWVELVFMMFILKLPVLYLAGVVWYAIRAEPEPLEGAARLAEQAPEPSGPWSWWRRKRQPRTPGGDGPQRTYARVSRPAGARAEARR